MDPKTILKTLKEASPLDLFLISFLALPFVFEAWLRILEKLEFGLCAQYWSLSIVLIAYILGVVAMLIGSNNEKKREIAKDQIIGYLTANSYNMMTLDTIREKINQGYSSQFLILFQRIIRMKLEERSLKEASRVWRDLSRKVMEPAHDNAVQRTSVLTHIFR
ncbi:MAG: hypothetical protein OQL11_13735 [Gammaproteobacteria bacterium]|nr:hypothetical protein [Gammaproteobacteria bacterium]